MVMVDGFSRAFFTPVMIVVVIMVGPMVVIMRSFLSVSELVKNCFHGDFAKRAFIMPFTDRIVQNIFDEKLWVWIDRIGFFVLTEEVEVAILGPKSQRHLNKQFA